MLYHVIGNWMDHIYHLRYKSCIKYAVRYWHCIPAHHGAWTKILAWTVAVLPPKLLQLLKSYKQNSYKYLHQTYRESLASEDSQLTMRTTHLWWLSECLSSPIYPLYDVGQTLLDWTIVEARPVSSLQESRAPGQGIPHGRCPHCWKHTEPQQITAVNGSFTAACQSSDKHWQA